MNSTDTHRPAPNEFYSRDPVRQNSARQIKKRKHDKKLPVFSALVTAALA